MSPTPYNYGYCDGYYGYPYDNPYHFYSLAWHEYNEGFEDGYYDWYDGY